MNSEIFLLAVVEIHGYQIVAGAVGNFVPNSPWIIVNIMTSVYPLKQPMTDLRIKESMFLCIIPDLFLHFSSPVTIQVTFGQFIVV